MATVFGQSVPVPLPSVDARPQVHSAPLPPYMHREEPVVRVAQVPKRAGDDSTDQMLDFENRIRALENLPPGPITTPQTQQQAVENRIRQLQGLPPAPGTTAAQENASANVPLPAKATVDWTGELQADIVMVDQSEGNKEVLGNLRNFTDFRRARLGALGNLTSNTIYRLEFDFALQGRPSFLDVYGQVIDLPVVDNVRIGHFFEPFSLQRLTANRFQTFMERPLLDAFAPARNMGVMAYSTFYERRGTWALGLFGADSNDFDEQQTDRAGQAVTGRVTWLPIWDEPSNGRYYMHVGACGSVRLPGDRRVRYGYWPGFRPGAFDTIVWPRWADTGFINASQIELIDFEWALVWGPTYLQSEYARTFVRQSDGQNLQFDAWYLEAGWCLTGEHRPYILETATFTRLNPFENFFRARTPRGMRTGRGAWQIAARLDYLNLNDKNVQGGRLVDVVLGVNWFVNPYTRVYFNYAYAALTRGEPGATEGNLWGMRAQFEF